MLKLEDNFNTTLEYSTYIALGSFDGLHIGHMSLINKTVEMAKRNNAKSMVCTFKNHPLTIINKEITPKLLMDNLTKIDLLAEAGIDIINMMEFNTEFMKIDPETFILNMLEKYKAKGFITGFNYRFGYKNLGDIDMLTKLSKKYGFSLNIVDPVKYKGELVSSSRIRNIISEDGDMKKVNKIITRPFMLKGLVIKGKQLGRTIGFPTINMDYDKSFVLPRGGVYFTIVEYQHSFYKGITNVGYNPTVSDNKLSIETNLLDFDKSIYGEEVKLFFIQRIRDEKKFESLEALKKQLLRDKNYAKKQKNEMK